MQAGRSDCVRSRHYPCFAGDSATRYDWRLLRRVLRLRCAPSSTCAQGTPSAERSEARAGCVRRRHLCRVASPLVMAAGNAPNAFRLQAGRTPRVRGRHYPCCAGDSATRYIRTLRRHPLRLRCAPSSWALPKRQSEPPQRRALQHERGAQRSASRLRAASPPVSCGITSGDGGHERAKRLQTAGWAHTARARPPLPLLRRG
jgi:hypothetical protein